jgi:hypothetical protein
MIVREVETQTIKEVMFIIIQIEIIMVTNIGGTVLAEGVINRGLE